MNQGMHQQMSLLYHPDQGSNLRTSDYRYQLFRTEYFLFLLLKSGLGKHLSPYDCSYAAERQLMHFTDKDNCYLNKTKISDQIKEDVN